ncbi:MAG: hypothetical protein ACRDD4_00100 [Culicoidibacterales bacterium]
MKREPTSARELDADFRANGIGPDKFWRLPDETQKIVIRRYCQAVGQKVSNRRFNFKVHNLVVKNEKSLFQWLSKQKYYQEIVF